MFTVYNFFLSIKSFGGAGAIEVQGTIRRVVATVRCQALDLCLANAEVGDSTRRAGGGAAGVRHAAHSPLVKGQVADSACELTFFKNSLGGQIGHRRVVLMHRAYEHPIGRGAGGLGQ